MVKKGIISAILLLLTGCNLKKEAEELRKEDKSDIDFAFDERLVKAGCTVEFSEVEEYDLKKSYEGKYPASPRTLYFDYRSRHARDGYNSPYTTGPYDIKECPEKRGKFTSTNYDRTNHPLWVYGLPHSLSGKEISVVSTIPTQVDVETISLVTFPFNDGHGMCYKIEHEKGKFNRGRGEPVDLVVIRGPMDYCITDRMQVDEYQRTCDQRFGQLVVTIKPDTLEQTCREIKREKESKIENLPPLRSYMWGALWN